MRVGGILLISTLVFLWEFAWCNHVCVVVFVIGGFLLPTVQ